MQEAPTPKATLVLAMIFREQIHPIFRIKGRKLLAGIQDDRCILMERSNQQPRHSTYINVMEDFVAQEVKQQLLNLPMKVRRYIKVEEVVTYALNRLPALYASSEKGWQYQHQLAQRDLQQRIQSAVRQALIAVQVDPIRLSQPIRPAQSAESEAVLQALRAFFKVPDLDWATALRKLHTLKQSPRHTEAMRAKAHHPVTWQPGTHGSEVAWIKRRQRQQVKPIQTEIHQQETNSSSETGWDNIHYRL